MKNVIYNFIFATILCCPLTIFAQKIGDNYLEALECINRGYIQHGVNMLQKSVNSNGMQAQFFMAVCYENGIVVKQDNMIAFKLYRRAAERGLPDAMLYLARFYKEGIVVSQNDVTYNEWLARYQKKGGQCVLPDLISIYNEGLKHPENYAMNPNGSSVNGNNGSMLAIQNNGNINSNNTIGSNNQTINNITIIQAPQTQLQPAVLSQPAVQPQPTTSLSDVDQNIPTSAPDNENTFALVIANENYQDVAKVPSALHDGEIFAEYCAKTLGIPQSNIHFVKDATLNNLKRELNLMQKISAAYNGNASFIFYYAGHGVPDESTKNAYLLPVDGYVSDITTCYRLGDLYSYLGNMGAAKVVVLLDACFSGAQRDNGMLKSARGVAIKAKTGALAGNMIVLSAAQGDETAYMFKEQNHGMFTYFLLKMLKDSIGEVTIGGLANYIKDNVVKKSLVANGKQQTPSVNASPKVQDNWKTWKLK